MKIFLMQKKNVLQLLDRPERVGRALSDRNTPDCEKQTPSYQHCVNPSLATQASPSGSDQTPS